MTSSQPGSKRTVFSLRAGMLPLVGRRLGIVIGISAAVGVSLAGIGMALVSRGWGGICAGSFFFGLCVSLIVRGILDRNALRDAGGLVVGTDGVKIPGFLVNSTTDVLIPPQSLGSITLISPRGARPGTMLRALYLYPPTGGLLNFNRWSLEEPLEDFLAALQKHLGYKVSYLWTYQSALPPKDVPLL